MWCLDEQLLLAASLAFAPGVSTDWPLRGSQSGAGDAAEVVAEQLVRDLHPWPSPGADSLSPHLELRGQQPELRDLFLCHAWDDRRGVATELNDLLEAEGVSVWFSEKDILLGQPFMREIDRGLAKSRAGLVLITPALLKRVNNRGFRTRSSRSFWRATSLSLSCTRRPMKRSGWSAPCSAPDTGWTRRKIR